MLRVPKAVPERKRLTGTLATNVLPTGDARANRTANISSGGSEPTEGSTEYSMEIRETIRLAPTIHYQSNREARN